MAVIAIIDCSSLLYNKNEYFFSSAFTGSRGTKSIDGGWPTLILCSFDCDQSDQSVNSPSWCSTFFGVIGRRSFMRYGSLDWLHSHNIICNLWSIARWKINQFVSRGAYLYYYIYRNWRCKRTADRVATTTFALCLYMKTVIMRRQ